MNFTPGPWRTVEDAQGICGILHPTKHGVAVAWFSAVHQPSNGYVGDEEYERGRPERQANAHLIAAAPDLYDAAVAALNKMESYCYDLHISKMHPTTRRSECPDCQSYIGAYIDQLRAAISKADGGVA